MIQENQIIPFTTSVLPGKNWLVFAPHADDESIGMGGTIIDAGLRGVSISLVVMTNGAYGGNIEQEKSEIIHIREQEVKNAGLLLGIKQISFLQEEDRGLSLTDKVIDKITDQITKIKPDVVFIPSALEPHPDHRMTSELVWIALQKLNYSGSLFSYDISVQSPISHLVDITDKIEKKVAAISIYYSQLAQNNYIDVSLALNKARTYTLSGLSHYAESFKQLYILENNSFASSTFKSLQIFFETEKIDVSVMQNQIMELQKHSSDLLYQNQQLNLEISLLKNSISFKITQPLRLIKKLILGLKL